MAWYTEGPTLMRTTILAASLLLLAPMAALGPGSSTAGPPSAQDRAEGLGLDVNNWIVGIHDLDAEDLADGRWHGHEILSTNQAIGTLLVDVEDLGAFQEDAEDDNVRYTQWDDPLAFVVEATPDDPGYPDQYGFPQISAPGAWDTTFGSPEVTVSIIDTGIDQDHEDLQGVVAAQHDFVNGDGTANDVCGHGTHVAGTVAANTDNGIGVAGTAPGSQLLIAKALTNTLLLTCTGSTSDIADAITWSTDNGADIISMSLGSSSGSQTLQEAVEYAWENGVLLVAAAGNDGQCTDCVGYPAAYPEVVAVTCTDSDQAQCSFSSQGPQAELAAPGDDILSTYNDGGYTELSGTSMSTPHVSGVAALLLAVDDSLTNSQLRETLNSTAQDLGSSGLDNVYGHGEIIAEAAVAAVAGSDDGGGDDDTNSPPTADVTFSCTDLTCDFDGSGSSDSDGSISSYEWDLGDGDTATGQTVTHTYETGGTYTVTLTVTDDEGATETASQEVSVNSDTNSPPTAEVTSDCAELTCDLDGSGSSDSDGSISSYEWDLGDGDTATGQAVTHTYETGGTYTVTLTVTDDQGATDSTSQTVSVSEPSSGPLLFEDFDDGTADGFTTTGLWHVSDACADPPSSPNYLGYQQDSSCDYDTGATTTGTATVSVDLSGTSVAELSFDHRWETESTACGLLSCADYDIMEVQVSTDDGSSWTTLAGWTSMDDNQPSWTPETLSLDSYTGQTVEIRFLFDSQDGAANDHPGWFVDNVQVG